MNNNDKKDLRFFMHWKNKKFDTKKNIIYLC